MGCSFYRADRSSSDRSTLGVELNKSRRQFSAMRTKTETDTEQLVEQKNLKENEKQTTTGVQYNVECA